MEKIIKIILLIAVLISGKEAQAACDSGGSGIWISSADSTSVASCISSAASGDTVYVQAGTFSWSPSLTKHISLIGGYGGGTTTINGSIGVLPSLGSQAILRISNFTINGGGGHDAIHIGSASSSYNLGGTIVKSLRIDHCTILNTGYYGIENYDNVYGVIDHNVFGSAVSHFELAPMHMQSPYLVSIFTVSPQNIWIPGTEHALYVEDNYFYIYGNQRFQTTNIGGHMVVRYNTFSLSGSIQGLIDLHGTQGQSFGPSVFGVEIYGNILLNGSGLGEIADIRSGHSPMFYNSVQSGSGSNGFQMYWGVLMVCPPANQAPDDQCIHDNYMWNNRNGYTGSKRGTYTGTTNPDVCGSYSNRPLTGRDFFDDVSTNPGITSGTLANIPGTCSIGQGYWSTDQTASLTDLTGYVGDITTYPTRQTIVGTLYKCTATNTWTSFFTPYAYPHPLLGRSVRTITSVTSGNRAIVSGLGNTMIISQ